MKGDKNIKKNMGPKESAFNESFDTKTNFVLQNFNSVKAVAGSVTLIKIF